MGEKKRKAEVKPIFVFGKKNYKFMFIGLAVIALGFILMAGGGSDDPNVFKAMILASTPCPIMDVVTGKLLMGKKAVDKYRENPDVFIVGYKTNKEFWDKLLRIGEDLTDETIKETDSGRDTRSLSERFRTTRTGVQSNRRSEDTVVN